MVTKTKVDWVPRKERVPSDRRDVHVWGVVLILGKQLGKPRYLGMSRFNRDMNGGDFDIERSSDLWKGWRVTHWTEEFEGPSK